MSKSAKKYDSRFSARKSRARTRLKRGSRHRAGYWYGVLWAAVAADWELRGDPADLSEREVLAWGDAYFARTGEWPVFKSGPIPESPGETWLAVEAALAIGLRGFPPRGSLPRFFAEHRGRYNRKDPSFSIEQILKWADAWHARKGRWPTPRSGAVPGAGGITWTTLNGALRLKRGGLPGGSSLACLLAESRGVRNLAALPSLSVNQILAWGGAHHTRTGKWPTTTSGSIPEAPGETWAAVGYALREGLRGLSGCSSLKRLFGERLGTKSPNGPAPLSIGKILAWADAFHARSGRWPIIHTPGPVAPAAGDTWRLVDTALRDGLRGLPGGSSLARLLHQARGVRNAKQLRPMTVREILRWADAYHDRHGTWPIFSSGPIPEAPGETWKRMQNALIAGLRGLPRRSSLPRLLKLHRGVRNRNDSVPFTVEGVLAWADAHRARTGEWPHQFSGPIPEAPDESWSNVHNALARGTRGLPGNSTLSRFLAERCGRRNRLQPPGLTIPQILTWADAFRARTGRWPGTKSGQIPEAAGESWCSVQRALKDGLRGLPGRSSLARLRRQRSAAQTSRRCERAGDGGLIAASP